MRFLNYLIPYTPFLVYFLCFLLNWYFEWEITGSLAGTLLTLLLAGGCFYSGLKRQSLGTKRLVNKWLGLLLLNYLFGPVGKDWNVESHFRSGSHLYFVQTNNLAGATSGVDARISVMDGHFLLHNKRTLKNAYNYNTAEFIQNDDKLVVKLGRTYEVGNDDYPPHLCFELSPEQATETDCALITTPLN
ncbi:hypothetical protein ACFO3I_10000 [Rheinheimera marina]|uniref:Uncharacterized protein n=1 Tax=Rheinheimera marina TaxID=1774958 RepID=A0ABV9JM49_9GAMM